MKPKWRLLAAAAALCCTAFSGCAHRQTFTPAPAPKPVSNPLKGWAPWSGSETGDFPSTLAYVPLSWRELEPEEGVYAFDQAEAAHQMDRLRRQGVRFVLRVTCDVPGEEQHLDIPDWLYDAAGGAWYDGAYGKGFSPDYESPAFLEAHGRLMEALGRRYDGDPAVAWIELGTLGHWGEWHVDTEAGIPPFPKQAVTDRYVEQYLTAFPRKKLLLRRPYAIGGAAGLGLYNDSFGQAGSHDQWLDWIAEGYISSQNGERLAGMPDFWQQAPSGGEFAADRDLWDYVLEDYDGMLDYIRASHTSWMGPRCFGSASLEDLDPGRRAEAARRVNDLSREMGYTFSVTRVEVTWRKFAPDLEIALTVENQGVAPIYENWPLCLELADQTGQVVRRDVLDGGITGWLPGTSTFHCTLEGSGGLPPGTYELRLGILDPVTGAPGIRLANQGEVEPCLYRLASFAKKD